MSTTARYRTITTPAEGHLREMASHFIAFAFPMNDEAAFKKELARISVAHHSARHHCFAWVLGAAGTRFRANDAGEPAGTAGRPILRAIRDRDLTFIGVVVVRYFGGTLLGKAGLVRAYGGAARLALDASPITECVVLRHVIVRCRYTLIDTIKSTVSHAGGVIAESTYDEICTLRVGLPMDAAEDTIARWRIAGAAIEDDQLK